MTCKKGTHEKCLCLKRKGGGCVDCEKQTIERIAKSDQSLHDIFLRSNNSPNFNWDVMKGLYVNVDGLTGSQTICKSRSAVDILRGVCDYCNHDNWERCNGCMWANGNGDEDHWTFDERLLIKKE